MRAVIKRLGAWKGSTSGVERLFSKMKRVGAHRTELCSETLQEDATLCCLSDFTTGSRFSLEQARKVWALSGSYRGQYETRRDKGIKRKPELTAEMLSETQWRKRRHLEVAERHEKTSLIPGCLEIEISKSTVLENIQVYLQQTCSRANSSALRSTQQKRF